MTSVVRLRRPAASRLVQAAEADVPELARTMVEAFVTAIPVYGVLPAEQVRGEIQGLCRTMLRAFFATLREGRSPSEAELAEPRASAARRAEERVPLDAVLSAYHLGGRIGWEALCSRVRPGEQEELLGHAAGVLDYLRVVTGAVAAAYLEEQQAISGEARDAQRTLVQAMLDGGDVDGAAARAGVRVGGAFEVAAFTVETGGSGADPGAGPGASPGAGPGAGIVGRRRQRRISEALDRLTGARALSLLGPDGGLVILPSAPTGLAQLLGAAAGAPVTVALAGAGGVGDVPAAGRLAQELLTLARSTLRPPGDYRMGDLMLDYQLSRPSPAHEPLAALLEPLARNPDFLPTLTTWLATGLDRRAAAAALHVHPNTLDYRLRRIGELTGVDPTTGQGSQLLAAASAARRHRAGG